MSGKNADQLADPDLGVNVSPGQPPVVEEPDTLGVGVAPAPDPDDQEQPKRVSAREAGIPKPTPHTEVKSPEGEVKTVDYGDKATDRAPRRRR
jgi:hypothetical protein